MKHNIKVTIILIILFLLTQLVGLWVSTNYSGKEEIVLGITTPKVEQPSTSFLPVFVLIILATVLGLILARFQLSTLWRFWFLFTIWLTLVISFNSFLGKYESIIIATIFSLLRVFKNNTVIHNFTEIFIYGAIATLFTPIFNITSIIILLLLISVYDFIAVRKTKHMIKLAKFEGSLKVFAGLLIPYKKGMAILGGGDIGFPLLFASVVMRTLNLGLTDFRTYIIPLFAAISLTLLFIYGDKKKYYPAMPYITAGSLVGYAIVALL